MSRRKLQEHCSNVFNNVFTRTYIFTPAFSIALEHTCFLTDKLISLPFYKKPDTLQCVKYKQGSWFIYKSLDLLGFVYWKKIFLTHPFIFEFKNFNLVCYFRSDQYVHIYKQQILRGWGEGSELSCYENLRMELGRVEFIWGNSSRGVVKNNYNFFVFM